MEIKKVQTDRFQMEYFSFGQGPETFVMIPGMSAQSVMKSADLVAEQYEMFTKDYTVYVFDPVDPMPDVYSMEQMAEDTAEAMNQLGLKNVHLFGASLGGIISQLIAEKYPSLVTSLILGSTTSYVSDKNNQIMRTWEDLANKKDGVGLYLNFTELVYPPAVCEAMKDTFIQMGQNTTDEEFRRFAILARMFKGLDITENLTHIQCPVLVLSAANDQVFAKECFLQIIEKLKGNKRLSYHLYDEYGHAAYDMAPDYKQRIYEFVKKHSNGIAYCGLDCFQCDAYLATIHDDQALREKTAKQWSEWNQVQILPEDIHCTGCRMDGVKSAYCDSLCEIRQCALKKEVRTCGDCAEMETCSKLSAITSNNAQALENLKQ